MTSQKPPIQFTLGTLFLVTAALAALLGTVCWLGPEVIPFEVAAVGAWVSWKTKGRRLLVWLVPALWAACAFGSWHHPGDEYVLFVLSVLPSVWIGVLLEFVHLDEVYLLLIASGAVPMAGVGFLLDRFGALRRLWAIFYLGTAIGLLVWDLLQHASLRAANAKNGSIWAYVFAAANIAMYLSALVFLVGGTIAWFRRRLL
jgi:hypothetical protein